MKIMYIQVEEAVYATARSPQFTYLGKGDGLAFEGGSQIVMSISQSQNKRIVGGSGVLLLLDENKQAGCLR